MTVLNTQPKHTQRYWWIDALRGLAILAMVAYHFCFDLNMHGIIHQEFNQDVFWLTARTGIVSLFLLIVGISIVLANANGNPHFWRRAFKLLACAGLVTLGSAILFPQSYIFFGILHFILLASLIGRLVASLYWTNLLLGLITLIIGLSYANPVFDQPALQWIGLMTFKPYTEDYVPLLPWLGLVLIGMFLGHLVLRYQVASNPTSQPRALQWLSWLGRKSLSIYMLHQLALLGGLSLWAWLFHH